MIRFACEIPVPNLSELSTHTSFDFALTHLVESNDEYARFYSRQSLSGRFVMLDNSSFELGKPVSGDRLINAAIAIKASEIVLPDCLGNRKETVNNVEKFLQTYRADLKGLNIKLAAVVQGTGLGEIVKCYEELIKMQEISTLCIPFDLELPEFADIRVNETQRWMYNRILVSYAINSWRIDHDCRDSDRRHHLLGASNPYEVFIQKQFKWIDSIDTSSPIQQGILGVRFNPTFGIVEKNKTKVDFNKAVTEEQKQDIFYNLRWFGEWCGVGLQKVF